jgi:HTH-type transcriptional regulator / antitoxin HigA
MDIKPIRTDDDYQAALAEIERLFEAEPGSPEGDRLDVWVTLVEAYEDKHFAIPLPDPIEAIEYHMERLGLHRRDLEPFLGSRARVSEILNRKRPLTLSMMRRLSSGLDISLEVLAQKYPLAVEPSAGKQSSQAISIHEEKEKYN